MKRYNAMNAAQKIRGRAKAFKFALVIGLVSLAACGGQTAVSGNGVSSTAGASSAGGSMFTGGASFNGGSPSTGGIASAGGTTSILDGRTCTSDSDCAQCAYVLAPSNTDDCANALACCGGPVLNKTTCTANYNAWVANCSAQSSAVQQCPCIGCAGGTITCTNGECSYSCAP